MDDDAGPVRDPMTLEEILAEIERLRVALSQHRDVNFRLGALYALDAIAGFIRRAGVLQS
jgi:hypothetical protein